MSHIPSARLTVPKAAEEEIIRNKYINAVLGSSKKFVYVQAGAGYGKTTLLSQIARMGKNTVWLSLAGESDIFAFVQTLCEAAKQPFSDYNFTLSEYIPFAQRENFIAILAGALVSSIENRPEPFTVILDDLHTIQDTQARELIACLVKYAPDNVRICLGSREAPWPELVPFFVKGSVMEITQKELAFTKEEVARALGFDDDVIYRITEGWPLAIRCFKVLRENGASLKDILMQGNEALHSYLFYEYIGSLTPKTLDFLKNSVCFDELDPQMLNAVLNIQNAKHILESLVSKNIFTIKTVGGQYRYHSLLREYLLEDAEASHKLILQRKAARYYLNKKEYFKSAEYAIDSGDMKMLQKVILASYKILLKSGDYSGLCAWFQALGEADLGSNPELLLAKGAFLSSVGNFIKAKACLDAVIPLLKEKDTALYIEAMIHKARVLRNLVSFGESNKLLDELICNLDGPVSETTYEIVIEKLYNLCWNSQIKEAYGLASQMIEACARDGNIKVKAWFERYLCAVYYFAGQMKESVYYYEKSLELPESERRYLDMHSVGIYAAKAYQMLGDRERSLAIISAEPQRLRNTGKYEEMCACYLFAAEIHYQNTFINRLSGGSQTFETTIKYFNLAAEYAPLYRKTEFQMQWTKTQRLTYSLIFTDEPREDIIAEIFSNFNQIGDYLKTIVLGRLFGYFAAVSDSQNAVKYAKLCIEAGEKANMMLLPTLAYGILAREAIAIKYQAAAVSLTRRYLRLCSENGVYEQFRMRKAYDPVIAFAFENGIEPGFTEQMMAFAGYKGKKVYIETFGGFAVFPYKDREKPIKMRTRRERELLAFLLNAGDEGVTKEQIYSAIWSESESADMKKLIGVNLAQIKKDLAGTGIENAVIRHEGRYSICRDEIKCDLDLFKEAVGKFNLYCNNEEAQKIISLYKGEYLPDFEALWATPNRMKYHEAFEEARNAISQKATVTVT